MKCHLFPFRRSFRLSASWILFCSLFLSCSLPPSLHFPSSSLLCLTVSYFIRSPHFFFVCFTLYISQNLMPLHPPIYRPLLRFPSFPAFAPSLCPSPSLLETTTHRLDELMMCSCLDLPRLHIHHNIYHIIIYLLGCFTYRRISKSSPVFAFSLLSLFPRQQQCSRHEEKKCADLLRCYTRGQ